MEILSEVFLVTYSILYGIMLNSCIGLNLFPFGKLCVKNKKYSNSIIAKRFSLSILFINIIPIVVFAFFLVFLLNLESNMQSFTLLPPLIQVLKIIGVFLSSLCVFIFYRFYMVLIIYRNGRWLYDLDNEDLTKGQCVNIRFIRKSSAIGHIFSIFIYIFFFLVGFILIYVI